MPFPSSLHDLDTLWSVKRQLAPEGTRERVAADSRQAQPGEQLTSGRGKHVGTEWRDSS